MDGINSIMIVCMLVELIFSRTEFRQISRSNGRLHLE